MTTVSRVECVKERKGRVFI